MTGCYEIGLDSAAELPELAKLQPGIANHARIRSAARKILIGKVVDDAVEFALEVEGVERDVEPVGHSSCVASINCGAATFLVVPTGIWLVRVRAGAHEQADNVVPLFLEQHRRCRAIDASGHGQHDPTAHETP